MARKHIPDELWQRIKPLLSKWHTKTRQIGRPRVDNRIALEGIVHVLRTGIAWRYLPSEIGCSGMTCWRRLRDWQERWVVERTISWFHGFQRLRIRWERRDDIHMAFMTLAACIICLRFLLR